MAPKKAQRITIRSQFLDSIAGCSISGPDELSQADLVAAYGLTRVGPQPQTNRIGQSFECTTTAATSNSAQNQPHHPIASTSSSLPAVAPSVLLEPSSVASSDDEMIIVSSTPKPLPKTKTTYKSRTKPSSKSATDCNHDNCKHNPLCTAWLGQAKWEDTEGGLELFSKRAGLGMSPLSAREPGLPVGLRNLGATCYVNSFLQVWFQDLRFRRGIYSCLPPANGKVDASPLFQLQVLFAFLEKSNQGVYDPAPFVKSLRLDTTEQQDAQEFSKLFLDLLSREFKQQVALTEDGKQSVATLLADQFEGTLTYGTKCAGCKNKTERPELFNELEISLKAGCKLEDRIAQSLESERLTDDNQYFCDRCQAKQDAVRYTRIDALPPVLHFSLARFAFDWNTNQRTKVQHVVSYPLKLDMGQFLPSPASPAPKPEVWYQLKGVLMHKGKSAQHGHYVAQVHDIENDKWFLFDDEDVAPIDDLNAPSAYDEDDEPIGKKRDKKAAFPRDQDGNVRPRSKDPYMLIYTRVEPEPGQAKADEPRIASAPPPLALSRVEMLDQEHAVEVQTWEDKADAVKKQFKTEREKKRSVYTQLSLAEDETAGFLVSQASLSKWITAGLEKKSKADTGPLLIDLTEDTKIHDELALTSGPASDQNDVQAAAPAETGTISPTLVGSGSSDDRTTTPLSDSCAPTPVLEMDESLLCEHGKVAVDKAGEIKLISHRSVEAFKALGGSLDPELSAPDDLCRDCVYGLVAEQTYIDTHPSQVQSVKEVNSDDIDEEQVWISKKWFSDWQREIPKMHVKGTASDPSPSDGDFASHVTCPHGQLQPDVKRRTQISHYAAELLEAIFPGWEMSSLSVPCELCADAELENSARAQEEQAIRTKERDVLKALLDLSQPKLVGLVVFNGLDQYIIPREWARQWRAWAKPGGLATSFTVTKVRPDEVDNSAFVCEHGKVLIDVGVEVASPKAIALVCETAWDYLRQNYNAGPAISISRGPDGLLVKPELCEGCLQERRQSFITTKLEIRMISKDEIDKDGKRIKSSAENSETASGRSTSPEASRHQPSVTRSGRPTRNSSKQSSLFTSKPRFIEMSKTDTVKDLKVKIYQLPPNPSPLYQRLWHGELELANELTVAELGLGEGSAIDLLVFDGDSGKADWTDIEKKEAKDGKRRREEGFGGTGLLGGWDDGENKAGLRLSYGGEVEEVLAKERGPVDVDDGMDVDAVSTRTTRIASVEDEAPSPPPSPKKAKINTVAPTNGRKGKPNSNSSLFGMEALTTLSAGSKRAAREAASASPVKPRSAGTQAVKSEPKRGADKPTSRTSDYSRMELEGDEEGALAAALAASAAEAETKTGAGGACSRCTFVNEAGVGECAMCEGPL